jgi:hypothetical protein
MESVVNRQARALLCGSFLFFAFAPAEALGQSSPPTAPAASNLWLVGGGAFATLRGDCQTCEAPYPFRHSGSVLANAGYRVDDRMDVGAEVFWMGVDTPDGQIRTTHFDAIAQFRPWSSQGFFIKGGAGMALVRNWVDVIGPGAENSKALSVVIGGGWAFRPAQRVGMQVFVSQHASAIGDLTTAESDVQDVIGNFWSIGAAIVFR